MRSSFRAAGGLLRSRSFHTSTGSMGTGRLLVWMLLVACLIASRWWSTSALPLVVLHRRACTSSPSESFCCSGLCPTGCGVSSIVRLSGCHASVHARCGCCLSDSAHQETCFHAVPLSHLGHCLTAVKGVQASCFNMSPEVRARWNGNTYPPGLQPEADMLSLDIWTLACRLAWLITGWYPFDFPGEEALKDHSPHEEVRQASTVQQIWVGPRLCELVTLAGKIHFCSRKTQHGLAVADLSVGCPMYCQLLMPTARPMQLHRADV